MSNASVPVDQTQIPALRFCRRRRIRRINALIRSRRRRSHRLPATVAAPLKDAETSWREA